MAFLIFISPVKILHNGQRDLQDFQQFFYLLFGGFFPLLCEKDLLAWASIFALKLTKSHQLL